jgi:hypothetical protein
MVYIKGYKYTTEQEAINACQECNNYYGIPVSPDDITQNWTDYQYANLNTPPFWYIFFDESLIPVLGQPTSFDVEFPPFPGS